MLFVGTGTDQSLHSSNFLPGDDDLARVADAMLAGYLGAAEQLAERPAPGERTSA